MPSHPIQPSPRIHPLEWLTVSSQLVFVSAEVSSNIKLYRSQKKNLCMSSHFQLEKKSRDDATRLLNHYPLDSY